MAYQTTVDRARGPAHDELVRRSANTFPCSEVRVWQHIEQAGPAGLSFCQVVTDLRLPLDVVLGAVLFLYTSGDVQCLLEGDDLRCVMR